MRKAIIIALLAAFVLFLLGNTVAYAVNTPQGGYDNPTAGQNPHGGYSATTDKCKVCHAVHAASTTTGAQLLLRSSAAEACVYCHITTAFTIKQVYSSTGDATQYTDDTDFNHSSTHQSPDTTYNGCTTCHAVHGANTIGGTLATYILRNNPGGAIFPGNTTGALTANATTLDEFCRDCHDGRTTAGAINTLWSSSQCGMCHTGTGDVYPGGLNIGNKWSHIMSNSLLPNDQTGFTYQSQVAWATSETCRTCHKGGYSGTYNANNNYPHKTTGANFLSDLHTTTGALDQVCIECHVSGTNGVGLTY